MARPPLLTTTASGRLDLPVFSGWRLHDNLAQFADILREHDAGFFARSAGAVDELMTDDRIQGVMDTRIGELLSSPRKVNPATDKRKAIKIAEALGGTDGYSGIWDTVVSPSTEADFLCWGIMLGVAVGRMEWDRTPDSYTPKIIPWHPANLRWDDWSQRFVMNTREGQIPLPRPDLQPEGDGEWIVWCPYGVQYGWRRGLIRSLGEVYLSRRYAKRDFNRWTERHAIGVIEGQVPDGSTDEAKTAFRNDLGNIGSDGVVITPQGDGTRPGYGVKMVDAGGAGTSWQGIKGLIDDSNTDVAVLILGGNLNTDMQSGSLAAAGSQRKTSVNRALRDASIATTFSRMGLSHWAAANYGDPALAPTVCYEVLPPEDSKAEAEALNLLGQGLQQLILASPRVDVEAILEAEGIPMFSEEDLAQREADAAEKMAEQAEKMGGMPGDAEADGIGESGGSFAVGDRVRVKGEPHMEGQSTGTVKIAQGNTYGILFDGTDEVHKWYVGAELEAEGGKEKKRAALGMLEVVKKRLSFQGLDVAIENPAGTIRQWHDGVKGGHTVMRHHYGFLEGYQGADKEELDVYLGDDEQAEMVYVIHQHGPVGMNGRWAYDEDKVMMGYPTAEAARAAFLAHRDDGDRAFGGMKVLTVEQFKSKLRRRGTSATTKLSATAAVGRDLVALATRARASGPARRKVAGNRRAAKYQEAVIASGQRRAAAALAPDLASLKALVDSCESLAELKPKLLKAYRGMDPTALARVIQKANILANLSGRAQALEEV